MHLEQVCANVAYGYDALNRVTTMIEAHNVAPNGSGQANADLNTTTVLYDDDQSTYWEAGMWVGHTVRYHRRSPRRPKTRDQR
jgi:hypothetical protein